MKIFGYEITKPKGGNKLYQAQYNMMQNGQVVWHEDKNETYISKGYNYNADLYSIVNYIATTASTIPWKLYTMKQDGTLDEIKNHPLIDLIERPNPEMGQALFINSAIGFKYLTGNTYIYAPKMESGLNKGQTKEMYVLPSPLVEIVFGSTFDPVRGFTFKYHPDKRLEIPKEECLHLKTWNPETNNFGSNLYGMSPIKAALRLLTQSNSAYAANTKSFQNMGAAGVFSRKSGQDAELTQEQARQLKKDWDEKADGTNNRVHFTSAQLDWTQLGLSPVDMAILESQKLSFRQFCNIFKFPSTILNDNENSSFNNILEAKKALYEDVIKPELYALRDELNRWLVPAYGENLYLDPDFSGIEALQENMKEKAEWLNTAWWIKGIDKQRLSHQQEDAEMDKYFIPAGIQEYGKEITPDELEKELTRLGIQEYKNLKIA